MIGKSYWIWHYGDYEIYHIMKASLRREDRKSNRPPVWKLAQPYVTVRFRRELNSDGGYFICHFNGKGYIVVDGKRYFDKTRVELSPGEHIIEIEVMNYNGLPSIYVESDVCPSDERWLCNHIAGPFIPVGFNSSFDRLEQNPEVFPFEYERKNVVATEKYDNGILYDFGVEMFGFINIENADINKNYEIFYGESREEALDTEYSVVIDAFEGSEKYKLRQRAFRYVFITPADDNLKVSADYEYLPLEKKGNFECDKKLFNDIYSIALRTFHLNCREGFLDGIKRDRWVWSGDVYQSARINTYLFADKDIEQRSAIGLIGKEPIEQHLNTIVDYSFLWIIGLYEHYMAYGDKAFLERIYDSAVSLMKFCETRLNEDGFIEGQGYDWTFIDWADILKSGPICAMQMLAIRSYYVMAYISELIGKDAKEYQDKYISLKNRVNEFYWSEEKGGYIESYKTEPSIKRHANIFALMYDIANEKQTQKILENVILNDDIPKITTPYFRGYELDVLAKFGFLTAVEESIESYWGDMIKLGATTVWEEFDPEKNGAEHYAMYGGKYEKSLCHAWGAGPIYLWGRYYLGVYPTSAGFETFNVEPKTGNIKNFRGTVDINGGKAEVDYSENKVTVTVTKAGGTLIWKGEKYILEPNKTITVK